MKRIILSDGSWFDSETAQRWERQGVDRFGNHARDVLWRTRTGTYVVEEWEGDFISDGLRLKSRKIVGAIYAATFLSAMNEALPDDLIAHLQDKEI